MVMQDGNVIEKLRQLNLELASSKYELKKRYDTLNKFPEHNTSGKDIQDSCHIQREILSLNKKIEELKKSINLLRRSTP